MGNSTYEQDLQKARELLYKAIESNDADDAWALVDFLHDQCILMHNKDGQDTK